MSQSKSLSKLVQIDLELKSKKWLKENDIENFIKKICRKILLLTEIKNFLQKNNSIQISISLVSDFQIKKINSQFRGKNKPTDVLSFSNLDESIIQKHGLESAIGNAQYFVLGDLIFAYETISKDSLAQKKKFKDHLVHLIAHGILHLIGYDHENEDMAQIMENLEVKILKQLKIKNPYL